MPEIVIEQAVCAVQGGDAYEFARRSAGFVEEWLAAAERLCRSFGERPAGVTCPRSVFAQPFNRRHVAIVQVEDQAFGNGAAPPRLAFHIMIVPQADYRDLGADPFQIAAQFPPAWNARGELPALTLPRSALPPRKVAQLDSVLRNGDQSPTLLGGTQALLDGGRVVFERTEADTELVPGIWMLLPTSTRFHLWPASYAFGNALRFDALVVPNAQGEDYEGYLTEQQAGDYPPGQYEFNLQMAVEAGDQQEVDVLLSRRSRRETWRMGVLLLVVVMFLVALSNWLSPTPEPRPPSRPGAAGKESKPANNSVKEGKARER
jgi:hypothetical protein